MHVNALGVTPVSSSLLSLIHEALKAPSPSDHFTCMSENLVYCISCHRCSHIYIGETGRSLRSRIGEHLRSVRNNTPGFPVTQHFSSASHSLADVQVQGMCLCPGSNILPKQLEMTLIFQLGTMQPDGLNINFKYVELCALLFTHSHLSFTNVVPNILRILTVFSTLKKGYTPETSVLMDNFYTSW